MPDRALMPLPRKLVFTTRRLRNRGAEREIVTAGGQTTGMLRPVALLNAGGRAHGQREWLFDCILTTDV